MKIYTVRLESGTIGKMTSIDFEYEETDIVEITFHDENGNTQTETGAIAEILETEGSI